MKHTFQTTATTALCAALIACGGGSGDPPPGEPPAAEIDTACPTPSTSTLAITTDGLQPVQSKEDYLRATLQWSAASATTPLPASARIKGRGNSTWDMEKKPYKLKLDDQVPLLGMPAGKDWALLANHADKTLLRNALAFCVARVQGLPHTPDSRMLELTLNGSYDGLYQLTNKTYEVEDLVKAGNQRPPPAQGAAFDDAFILETDVALREDHWFISADAIPYAFTSEHDAAQRERIAAWLNQLETLLADNADPQRLGKIAALVDLPSLADFYLVSELLANVDTYQSSTYLYRLRGGKLTFGPVWDFDQALGPTKHNQNPEGWLLLQRPHNTYLRQLLAEPAFAALVRERWARLAERIPGYTRYIQRAAGALDAAQQRNFARWPILNQYIFTNVIALGSYSAEVAYMTHWLEQRSQWMAAHLSDLSASAQASKP